MLSAWEAIKQRRSIRKYSNNEVSDELITQILEAARLAPSGCNVQPWRFIVVRDEKIRQEICQICGKQQFIQEAPVTIVCFADLNRYSLEAMKNRWTDLVGWGIAETLSGELANKETWEPSPAAKVSRDKQLMMAVSNTYIAVDHILIMAAALGLGTCCLGATDDGKLNKLFGLPDNIVSVAVVPVGYPAGQVPASRPRVAMKQLLLKPLPEKNR
jgi:nitroreductase